MASVPYKRSLREIPRPFHQVTTQQEDASYEPGRGPSPKLNHAGSSILDTVASETVRNKFPFFYKLSSLWYFVIVAQLD